MLLVACVVLLSGVTFAHAATIDTIDNPMNVTVDLFDYWITGKGDNETNPSSWGQDWNWNTWPNGPSNDPNQGINAGHALLFHRDHPSYGSEQFTGMTDPMRYWGPVVQGIVRPTLGSDGYPVLPASNTGRIQEPHMESDGRVTYPWYSSMYARNPNGESLAYLFDPTHEQEGTGRESFPGVEGLFKVDAEGYYVYDSSDNAARYNSGRFVVDSEPDTITVGASGSPRGGFWPFGTGTNRHYLGLHMNMAFSMPTDGQVLNPQGDYNDMIFSFAGDDDVWIYIDGVLIGDLGGIHQPSSIDINFATGDIIINGNTTSSFDRTVSPTRPEYIHTTIKEMWQRSGRPDPVGGWNGNTFADGSYHKLDFFYLERGNGDSNLEIRFNMINTGDFTAHKALVANPTEVLQRDAYKFELVGYDGKYSRDPDTGAVTLVDESATALMPKGASTHTDPSAPPTTGNVSRYWHDEGDYWVYRVGNTEDGNVNFGNADFEHTSLGDTYRYQIREVSSTDSGVDMDERVYYMEATVALDSDTGEYYLSKRYYTDETYTTRAEDVNFASFVNLKGDIPTATPQITAYKDLLQGDTRIGIENEQFSFRVEGPNGTVGKFGASDGTTGISTSTVTLPTITPVDFNGLSGTITRTYTLSEVVPEGATENDDGTFTYNGIKYDKLTYTATVTVTYDKDAKTMTCSVAYAAADGTALSEPPTFHNTVEPVSVSITKVWNDDAAAGATVSHPAVTFRVIRSGETGTDEDGNKLAAPLDNSDNPDRAADIVLPENATGDALTQSWTGLPKFDANGEVITYQVIEIGDVAGYQKGDASPIEGNAYAFSATNTLLPLSLTITKKAGPTGEETEPLQGAGFTLTRVKPDTLEEYVVTDSEYYKLELLTGEDGTVTFGGPEADVPGLAPGTYKISETTVPNGYQKAEDRYIVINADGTGSIGDGTNDPTALEPGNFNVNTRAFSVTITNTELPPLPSTGGPGDIPLLVAGAAMVIAAMVLLFRCGRRASS